jgi:hypothetical protein
MSVKLHFILKTVVEAGGFVAGAVFALYMGPAFKFLGIAFPWSAAVPIVGGVAAGFLIFRGIPARCPKCEKSTYPRGMGTVSYACRTCGHVETIYSQSGGDQYLV